MSRDRELVNLCWVVHEDTGGFWSDELSQRIADGDAEIMAGENLRSKNLKQFEWDETW
jgi:hypothetical protein